MIIKMMNLLNYYKALPYKSTNQMLKSKVIILRHRKVILKMNEKYSLKTHPTK